MLGTIELIRDACSTILNRVKLLTAHDLSVDSSVIRTQQLGLHRLQAEHWPHRDAGNGNRRVECPTSPIAGEAVFHAACSLTTDENRARKTEITYAVTNFG